MKVNIGTMKKNESLVLCKLNKTPIGEIPISFIMSEEKYIDEVGKLTLKVSKYITSQDKKKIINPIYEEVMTKRYLLLNDTDYYIIEKVSINKITGSKEVEAYSSEQTLSKFPIEIEDIGIQLITDDPNNDVYSLNTLLNEIGWKLGDVDDAVAYNSDETEKMRWQESVSGNWLDFLYNEIAEQFNCTPLFDMTERVVHLYDINTLGEDIQLCLHKDNYLKSKTKVNESNELITLLKLKGNEEVNIREHILGGYDFITNFSYFEEINEMSDELINALKKYKEMVEIRHPQWVALINEKNEKEKELTIKRNQWQISISTIECYKKIVDKYMLNGDTVNESKTKIELASEMDNELILRLEINDIVSEIEQLDKDISDLNILCKYESCEDENGNLVFSSVLLDELLEFIFIDTFSDDSFLDAESLIEKGEKILEERSRPTIEIEIDSINFLSRIIDNGFRLKFNGELNLCDIIILIDEDTQEEEYYYFVGYSIDYSNNSLELKLSNKKTNKDNAKTINKWLKESKKTKMLMGGNKYLFNDIKKNRLNMKERR